MKRLLLISCLVWAGAWATHAQENTNVAPRAAQVLRDACQYLAEAPYFDITAEIWREHVNEAGEKIQFTRSVEMEVRRPNRLHVEITSPHTQRGFWYDGKALTVLDRKENFYSTADMPDTLDATLDKAHDEFGMDLPLIDLAVSNPYANAMARVQTGRYFGVAQAMGFSCHHLAFTQDNVDWQITTRTAGTPISGSAGIRA